MTISTLRKARTFVLLPAAAVSLAVGVSGCSLAFDSPDDNGDKTHQTDDQDSQNSDSDSDSSSGASDANGSETKDPDSSEPDSSDSQDDGSSGYGGSDSDGSSDGEGSSGYGESDSEGSSGYGESDDDSGTSSGSGSSDSDAINKTFSQYLSEHGISARIVDRSDPGTPAVTISTPDGWSRAGSSGPEGSYMSFIDHNPEVGTYTPKTVVYMYKVSGDPLTASITAAGRQQITNLPGFSQTGSTSDPIGSYSTSGTAGTFDASSRKMGIISRTVVIPKDGDTYILHVQTVMLAEQASSEEDAIKEIQRSISII